ncbi:hypothetical protein HYQ44_015306 [Verticillium longisporum]|nr:hypothetical protein HYQ44_015306 [Verticillium longisporum]
MRKSKVLSQSGRERDHVIRGSYNGSQRWTPLYPICDISGSSRTAGRSATCCPVLAASPPCCCLAILYAFIVFDLPFTPNAPSTVCSASVCPASSSNGIRRSLPQTSHHTEDLLAVLIGSSFSGPRQHVVMKNSGARFSARRLAQKFSIHRFRMRYLFLSFRCPSRSRIPDCQGTAASLRSLGAASSNSSLMPNHESIEVGLGASEEEMARRAELKRIMHKRIQEELKSEEEQPEPSTGSASAVKYSTTPIDFPGGGPRDHLEFSIANASLADAEARKDAADEQSNAVDEPIKDERDKDCHPFDGLGQTEIAS